MASKELARLAHKVHVLFVKKILDFASFALKNKDVPDITPKDIAAIKLFIEKLPKKPSERVLRSPTASYILRHPLARAVFKACIYDVTPVVLAGCLIGVLFISGPYDVVIMCPRASQEIKELAKRSLARTVLHEAVERLLTLVLVFLEPVLKAISKAVVIRALALAREAITVLLCDVLMGQAGDITPVISHAKECPWCRERLGRAYIFRLRKA